MIPVGENEARKELFEAIAKYMSVMMGAVDREEIEKMIAGVLAFMWTNWHKEPYYPVTMLPVEESRPWWKFWA